MKAGRDANNGNVSDSGETMKLGKLADVYYTAAEARKVLGIDQDAFQYWAKTERIRRIYLPGRKQAVYSKKEINDMANRIEATAIAEKSSGLEFRVATLNDLEEEYRLARIIFGKQADTPEIRQGKQAFIKKNPNIDYHLYDNENFVGCIHIIPLKHQSIIDTLEGNTAAWLIDPKNIEQFKSGKPLECLFLDALTTPAVEPAKRSGYASYMITKLIQELTAMGNRGIEIRKVYGMSRTPSGIRILKSGGFQAIKEYDNGKITFELDVMNSDARVLRGYKEALEQWKNRQAITSQNVIIGEKESRKSKEEK
jgi:hypothetical protein